MTLVPLVLLSLILSWSLLQRVLFSEVDENNLTWDEGSTPLIEAPVVAADVGRRAESSAVAPPPRRAECFEWPPEERCSVRWICGL